MKSDGKYGITHVGVGSTDSKNKDRHLRIDWAGDIGSGVIEIDGPTEENDFRMIISGNEIDKELIKEVLNKLVDESEVEYRLLDNRLF